VNCCTKDKVSDSDFAILLEYLKDLKGKGREETLQKAQTIISQYEENTKQILENSAKYNQNAETVPDKVSNVEELDKDIQKAVEHLQEEEKDNERQKFLKEVSILDNYIQSRKI